MTNKEKHITLGQFLKLQGFVNSGGEVKHRINEFEIFVNGEIENRRGKKLYQGDSVEINGQDFVIELDEN